MPLLKYHVGQDVHWQTICFFLPGCEELLHLHAQSLFLFVCHKMLRYSTSFWCNSADGHQGQTLSNECKETCLGGESYLISFCGTGKCANRRQVFRDRCYDFRLTDRFRSCLAGCCPCVSLFLDCLSFLIPACKLWTSHLMPPSKHWQVPLPTCNHVMKRCDGLFQASKSRMQACMMYNLSHILYLPNGVLKRYL